MIEPLATLFTVPTGYNFTDPKCKGVDFLCWPTVAVSSIEHYESGPNGILGWDRVLLVTTLKRGSLYVLHLDAAGRKVAGPIDRYFQAENRYRDTAVSPDRRTLYVATDASGVVESLGGGVANRMQDPGAILAFTYAGEGTGAAPETPVTSKAAPARPKREPIADAIAPQFTAAQAAAGRRAYNTSCAVCHGNTLRNGAMGTPLAGEYFKDHWSGGSVREFFDRVHKTMPPAAPASLKQEVYADIVAYILEVNGAAPGATPLDPGSGVLSRMAIP
jgi:mono/diheme cytochrome c family protein